MQCIDQEHSGALVEPHDVCVALRTYRIRGRIKQQMVADILGVAQSQISRWESGRDIPRPHNMEAIRSLVWGAHSAELQSLMAFVRASGAPLVLLDGDERTLAVSRILQQSDSEWSRFGWAFRPERNPRAAPIADDLRRLTRALRSAVTVEVLVPFMHDGAAWTATARRTMQPIGGQALSLVEVAFAPDPDGPARRAELRAVDPGP